MADQFFLVSVHNDKSSLHTKEPSEKTVDTTEDRQKVRNYGKFFFDTLQQQEDVKQEVKHRYENLMKGNVYPNGTV